MTSILSLLQSVLMLLTIVSSTPNIPSEIKQSAISMAQTAILVANNYLTEQQNIVKPPEPIVNPIVNPSLAPVVVAPAPVVESAPSIELEQPPKKILIVEIKPVNKSITWSRDARTIIFESNVVFENPIIVFETPFDGKITLKLNEVSLIQDYPHVYRLPANAYVRGNLILTNFANTTHTIKARIEGFKFQCPSEYDICQLPSFPIESNLTVYGINE